MRIENGGGPRPLRTGAEHDSLKGVASTDPWSFGANPCWTMYQSVTRNIEVTVTPQYLPERSSPETGEYFWAYTIEITNRGTETVQLRTRQWHITDGMGRRQEVRGPGVVGKQPVLKPGESFEYTSGVPLPTASGFMTGSYGMVSADGEPFDIAIPTFSLDSPEGRRTLN